MNVMDVNVTTKSKVTEKQMFKDREPKKAKNATDWEKKTVEEVNGGNNSTYSKKHKPIKKGHPHPWRDRTQPGQVCQILLL